MGSKDFIKPPQKHFTDGSGLQDKDTGALFFLAVTNRGRSEVCCTCPAGPVIPGSEEALSERTWVRERNGDQAKFLSRSQFISVMVVAYIALE